MYFRHQLSHPCSTPDKFDDCQSALRRFFFGEDHAPRFLVVALLASSALRLTGAGMPMVGGLDAVVIAAVAVFWAFQEWWLHKYLLHAPFEVRHLTHCVRSWQTSYLDSVFLSIACTSQDADTRFDYATGIFPPKFHAHRPLFALSSSHPSILPIRFASTRQWLGTDIHVGHHKRAFYHVSIDSMSLVVPWFIAAASLFHVSVLDSGSARHWLSFECVCSQRANASGSLHGMWAGDCIAFEN
jgi:hypothetical protein